MIVTGRPTTVACSTRAQPRAVQMPSYRGVNRYPLGKQMVIDLPVRDPILRAPVCHTELSLCRGVRRVGHIDRRNFKLWGRVKVGAVSDVAIRWPSAKQGQECGRGHASPP